MPSMKKRILYILVVLVFLALHCYGDTIADKEKQIAKWSKDEQLNYWKREIVALQRNEMNQAMHNLYEAQRKLQQAKQSEGFFYTKKEDRATIRLLDEEYSKALARVDLLKQKESTMLAKLKPLYGIVSREFVQEQKRSIKNSINFAKDVGYDNAFYSSLFRLGEAESIGDLIIGFFVDWLMNYILVYPFAVLYYAFWTAPRSIYAYSSGITDIVPGALAYVTSVIVMCAPLIVLVGSTYLIKKYYNLDAMNRNARRRWNR